MPPIRLPTVLAIATLTANAASGSIIPTLQLLRGETFDGLPPGVTFSHCEGPPIINAEGELMLPVILRGTNVDTTNQYALALGRRGSFELLARGGQSPPGFPTDVIYVRGSASPFFSSQLDDQGMAFFGSYIAGPAIPSDRDQIYWTGRPGSYSQALREGDAAPGMLPGVTFASPNGVAFSASGQMLFRARLSGPGVTEDNDDSLWFGAPDAYALAAREGEPAAGLPGAVYSGNIQEPVITASGMIAFRGRAQDSRSRDATWYGRPEALAVAGVTGLQVPGFPDGTTYLFGRDLPAVNDLGQAVFQQSFEGTVQGSGLFIADQAGTRALILDRQQVPGWEPGPSFVGLDADGTSGDEPFALNNRGQVAFYAFLLDEPGEPFPDFALAVTDGVETSLVARRSTQAPGLPDGALFTELGGMTMNDAGQIVFAARVTGRHSLGLWGFDDSGAFSLIQPGDVVEVLPGDSRVVGEIGFAFAGIGPDMFNNSGDLAVQLAFVDGTAGVFTLHVPGPASGFVLGLMTVAAGARRRC